MSMILNGSNQYAWVNQILGTRPFTFFCWAKRVGAIANYSFVAHGGGSAYNGLQLGVTKSGTSNLFTVTESGASSGRTRSLTQTFPTDSWSWCAGRFVSSTSRKISCATGHAEDTGLVSPLGLTITALGVRHHTGLLDWYFNGKLAHVAIWDIQLSDSEIGELAAGAVPLNIQSGSLLAYWPLFSDALDYSGKEQHLTEVNSPTYDAGDHPPPGSWLIKIPYHKTYFVGIGGNEVWYKQDGGTLAELSAANGVLNTTNGIEAAVAFQKLFVANYDKLRVLDFGNTKITTDNIGAGISVVPDKSTVLQGASSNARMVVDFCTAALSAASVYGQKITTVNFVSSETVTGTNGGGNTVSFVLNAPQVSPPHWFTWTPFANHSDYGTMPDLATLAVRYRGRVVLAGNKRYPHQYWMSRVADPWDWLRAPEDPLSPVVGSNTDAGEVGDIIVAMVPYGDDYLVFGCAGSVHLMTGDPASGGRIDELDSTIGFLSKTAWCKDTDGNLYFLSRSGLYKMAGGRARPTNISVGYLPKLIKDWGYDPSTSVVVLAYDPDRQGILLTHTELATGVNTGYWFSLHTQRFYPVEFPDNCGVHSAAYIRSDTAGVSGMVLGCDDGYLRTFDDDAKVDDDGAADAPITSYVGWVEPIGDKEDGEGKLTSLTIELAGGESSGAYSDSDIADCLFYAADEYESCMERMKDGDTTVVSATISGPGRKARLRDKIRTAYLGVKIASSISNTTWALNKITGINKPSGRIR